MYLSVESFRNCLLCSVIIQIYIYITGSEIIVVLPLHEHHAQILRTTFLQLFLWHRDPQCMYFVFLIQHIEFWTVYFLCTLTCMEFHWGIFYYLNGLCFLISTIFIKAFTDLKSVNIHEVHCILVNFHQYVNKFISRTRIHFLVFCD